MDPSLFAALSGMGPQTGGFNPTPSESVFAQSRARSTQGLMEYALYTAPQVRASSMMTATALTGDPAKAHEMLKNSGQGQLIKDTYGMAMAAGLLPGGNPMNLAANVQQSIAHSGFSVGGMGGNGAAFGYGGITDQISRQVFDQIKNNFFSPVSGMGKGSAKGLDMSQLGDIVGQLTSRGSFAGLDAFNLVSSGGKMDLKVIPEKMKQINKKIEDYASMVKDASSIFGNLPISQITEVAERLTGMSMGEAGGIKAAKEKMLNIRAQAAAYGVNPEKLASNIMNATDTVQQQMFANGVQKNDQAASAFNLASASSAYGRQAALIAEKATFAGLQVAHASNVNANQLADKGIYTTRFTESDVSKVYQEGHLALGKERSFSAVDAAFYEMSQENSKITGPDREKIIALSQRMGSASASEQRIISRQISQIAKNSGVDLSSITRNLDESEIKGGTSQDLNNIKTEITQKAVSARLQEGAMQQISRLGHVGGGLLKNGSASLSGIGSLIGKFNSGTLEKIAGAVDSGGKVDEKALSAIYDETPSLKNLMTSDQLRDALLSITAGQTGDVGNNLRDVFSRVRTLNRGKLVANEQDSREAAARAVQSRLSDTSLGGPIDQESFGTALVRGFFGAGKIDDNIVTQALMNDKNSSGASLKLREDRAGLNVGESDISSIEKSIGKENLKNLYNSLGVKEGDAAGLAAALNTPGGFQALEKNIGGSLMQADASGNLRIFGEEVVGTKRKQLEEEAMLREAKTLMGEGFNLPRTGDAAKDLTEFNKSIRGGLTSEKLLGLASSSKENKYDSKEFESLARQFKNDPELDKHLKEKSDEMRERGETDKANEIKELRDALKSKTLQENGGSQYLGVLQIMSDSLSTLALYKQQ